MKKGQKVCRQHKWVTVDRSGKQFVSTEERKCSRCSFAQAREADLGPKGDVIKTPWFPKAPERCPRQYAVGVGKREQKRREASLKKLYRRKKLAVGQYWRALVFEGEELGLSTDYIDCIFNFLVIYQESYVDRDKTKTRWLCKRTNIPVTNEGRDRLFWFDDHGVASLEGFIENRKKKHLLLMHKQEPIDVDVD